MHISNSIINEALKKKNAIKVITGLSNFCIKEIVEIIKAANISNATYVDICSNKSIIKEIKKYTNLPVCVSSIDIKELYKASRENIDLIEFGNFDSLYSKGIVLSQYDILNLVQEITSFWPVNNLCVTIPSTLSLSEQIKLSINMQKKGIKVLQTEAKNIESNPYSSSIANKIFPAVTSLSSTYAISRFIDIPIITSSRINSLSSKLAILYGASGVGICRAIKNCQSIYKKSYYIKQIIDTFDSTLAYLPKKFLVSLQINYKSVYFDC